MSIRRSTVKETEKRKKALPPGGCFFGRFLLLFFHYLRIGGNYFCSREINVQTRFFQPSGTLFGNRAPKKNTQYTNYFQL